MAQHAPEASGPPTMIGMILERKGDRDGAKRTYQEILGKHPRAGVAANNLAWMLAEDGKYDEALKLATVATEELRDRPEPQDTLGWIYLQKNLPVHALAGVPARARSGAFERSLQEAPAGGTGALRKTNGSLTAAG